MKKIKSLFTIFLLVLILSAAAQNNYLPVTLTGFTKDVVADGTGLPSTSTSTGADADNAGYYFIDSTFRHSPTDSTADFFLPSNRIIYSQATPGNYFFLQPYWNYNSLRLDNTTNSGSLNFAVPQSAYNMYLLATSGGGSSVCTINVIFTDNTNTSFTNVTISDWYGGTPYAAKGIGRTFLNAPDPALDADNPRLYEIDLPITSTKLIKRIAISKANAASVLHVFAASILPRSPFCVSGPISQYDSYDIGKVTFGTLSNGNPNPAQNNLSAIGNYNDFTNLTAQNYTQGVNYTFSINQIAKTSFFRANSYAAYIDYNHDSIFDELYEKITAGSMNGDSGVFSASTNVTISLNSLPGTTRMRVVLVGTGEKARACGTYYYGETEDYLVTILSAPPCSLNPIAGLASSSDSTVCADTLFRLSLVGNSIAADIQYQWQISPDSNNWLNVSGANYTEFVTSVVTDSYYRCITTCVNSALSDTSSVVNIKVNPFYLCYCNTSLLGNSNQLNIGNFTYGGLNNGTDTAMLNNPTATAIYSDFRNLTPQSFVPGVKDSVSVTGISSSSFISNNRVAIYIDYNHDTQFNPISENVFNGINVQQIYGNKISGFITIPYNALTGITGLRVKLSSDDYNQPDPCRSIYEGETEDYLISILPAPVCSGLPNAGGAFSRLNDLCAGDKTSIHLIGAELANGLTYQWEKSNDSISWQSILNATDTVLKVVQNATAFYRCLVSCGAGNSATSQSIKIAMRPSNLCYCSDTLGGQESLTTIFINRVSIVGTPLNNASTTSPYVNESALSVYPPTGNTTCILYHDSTYKLKISTTESRPISCWIDYNVNGNFEKNEYYKITDSSTPGFEDSVEITIPNSANAALTGMRIRYGSENDVNDSTSACDFFYSEGGGDGETEDYFITIQCIASPDSAGAITGESFVTACINQNLISYFIDSIPYASNYSWSLPPGASFFGDSTSNSITVNFSAFSASGLIQVKGQNACGDGVASELFIDFIPIPVAEICRATIDSASQKTLLEWQKPIEDYVDGYVIFREIAGVYVNIDTVSNTEFSSYIDSGSTPIIQAEKYKIAVLDTCGNVGDISAPFEHQTIRLYGSIDWGGVAKLYWNDYVGIDDSSRYFNLLRDTTGTGAFNDSIAKNISPLSLMSFTDVGSAGFPNCRYVVEMVYQSNCNPSFRTLATKSTSRSNIKNKADLIFDSLICCGFTNLNGFNQGFKMYPNPAKNILNIAADLAFTSLQIRIFDAPGKTVFYKTVESANAFQNIQLQLPALKTGIYFIELIAPQHTAYLKLSIIEN
ncbi:MAG: T9SS type A sorting domain-containing protein [Bacteroidetes bacterium]|nr:T9SS type A sorting domain-containing protein [Bacteroidota bacterium]